MLCAEQAHSICTVVNWRNISITLKTLEPGRTDSVSL